MNCSPTTFSIAAVLSLSLLSACSSSDDSDPTAASQAPTTDTQTPPPGTNTQTPPATDAAPVTAERTGVLIDSAVAGISYKTASFSGTTGANGEFNYLAGETVTFSIGALTLPVVNADAMITPVDMGAGAQPGQTVVTNIARLLQSLDADGNPDNGIVIPAMAAQSAVAVDFFVTGAQFETNPSITSLVANSGSTNTVLISAEAANAHLAESLEIIEIPGS